MRNGTFWPNIDLVRLDIFGEARSSAKRRRSAALGKAAAGGGSLPLAREAGRQGAGFFSVVSRADGAVELGEELTYAAEGGAGPFPPFVGIG